MRAKSDAILFNLSLFLIFLNLLQRLLQLSRTVLLGSRDSSATRSNSKWNCFFLSYSINSSSFYFFIF